MYFRFYRWRHICSQAKIARRTCSLELGYQLCAVIPVAGNCTGLRFGRLKWQHRGRSLRSMTALLSTVADRPARCVDSRASCSTSRFFNIGDTTPKWGHKIIFGGRELDSTIINISLILSKSFYFPGLKCYIVQFQAYSHILILTWADAVEKS